MAVSSLQQSPLRRGSPLLLFPALLLCAAYGLLRLTFLQKGHGDIMSRCVLMEPNLSRIWSVGGIQIAELPRVTLGTGYSTKDSLGYGFWIMLRAADAVHLLTGVSGTTVVLALHRQPFNPFDVPQ
jgi:hypothetical protein